MLLTVRANATFDLDADTFVSLMVEPSLDGPAHRVREEGLWTSPTISCALVRDHYGNPRRDLVAPRGRFSYEFRATIDVRPAVPVPPDGRQHPPQELPPEVLIYTVPSRYCQSDLLDRLARSEFGSLPPGGARALAVAAWVRRRVAYRYGTTSSRTSALDTAVERVGVCRDFAHLTIALCRALEIPARYASGYALGLEPADFHAYAQVYIEGAWRDLDATIEGTRPALVPIAVGRDAADVPHATLWGGFAFREQVVEVRERPDRESKVAEGHPHPGWNSQTCQSNPCASAVREG